MLNSTQCYGMMPSHDTVVCHHMIQHRPAPRRRRRRVPSSATRCSTCPQRRCTSGRCVQCAQLGLWAREYQCGGVCASHLHWSSRRNWRFAVCASARPFVRFAQQYHRTASPCARRTERLEWWARQARRRTAINTVLARQRLALTSVVERKDHYPLLAAWPSCPHPGCHRPPPVHEI